MFFGGMSNIVALSCLTCSGSVASLVRQQVGSLYKSGRSKIVAVRPELVAEPIGELLPN